MAAKIDPETIIQDGDVIVRVGADSVPSPRGPAHYIYPVIQLIWPSTERSPHPNAELTIRWQDKLDATKPSKSDSPKYIGLLLPDGKQWIGYRVTDKDRALFESLKAKWGLWFLRVRRQGEQTDSFFTFFNDGGYFSGSIAAKLSEHVQDFDADGIRHILLKSWQDTLKFVQDHRPSLMPTQEHINRRVALLSKIPSIMEEIGGGPLPWKPKEMAYWGKPNNKDHDEAVSNYLMLLRALKQNSENKKLSEKFRQECLKMYGLMRRAKIFEISPESYIELHLAVDRHITEDIAHLEFHDPRDEQVVIPKEETELLWRRQKDACERLLFPDKLPFDVCWFALTGMVALSSHQVVTRNLDDGEYIITGILADGNGEHHELIVSRDYDTVGELYEIKCHIVTHHIEEEVTWSHPHCMAPFVLHAMVDCINQHQTTIVAQRKLGMHSQSKLRKGLIDLGAKKPIPPPFYTVHLRDKVIKEIAKGYSGGVLRARYAHRFDVRGHWCFKIYRGQMPMDPELELQLDVREYSIFKNRPVDQWVKVALQEREQALPQEGEWIAVKRFWKKSYVKGPENAEYVPSTRRATKGVLAFDNSDVNDDDSRVA